ncbi:MAG: UDP-N-acetylglucosamine--N-acetylmuramyl-(pentapeptide) pyrophosphoryl-undecaprenol N-acetylglucosamine transferase [Leptospirales bacterium]|nr:UDP-N-acetylglucosamine--N-acetylmuramyl-(pentapeptide) pyrophosphoryl-undecaprenol N-acetylglucosamine transferase [Leptospirales bacterium]
MSKSPQNLSSSTKAPKGPEGNPAPSIVVIAGGTGGHITPGLALCHALQAAGAHVSLLSLEKNRSYADFITAPFAIDFYQAPPLQLRSIAALLLPWRMLRALWQARRIFRERQAQLAVGMGGYSSAPALLMARWMGLKTALCEQNAAPGRVTRWLAGSAGRLYLNFPVEEHWKLPQERALRAGNPLRPALVAAAQDSPRASQQARALSILVLGGSQGAAQLNEMCLAAIASWQGPALQWTIQCGQANLEGMRAALPLEKYPNVELLGYVTGIEQYYRKADLAICRAGAGVLAELLLFALPAILIPYPFSADDHQGANARYLRDAGAALLLAQRNADAAELLETLAALAGDSARRKRMAGAARSLARPQAARTIAVDLMDYVANRSAGH